MRVALVHRSFNLGGSLGRDATLAARRPAARGAGVHWYCDPATSLPELHGATLHPVPALVHSRGRVGRPVQTLSFAIRATRAIRRDRAQYDIVDVKPKSLETTPFLIARETQGERPVPAWLQVIPNRLRVLVHQLPERAQIDVPLQEQLIVELYSK